MLNELARYYMCVHKNKFYYTNCGINRSCALCVSVHTFSDIFFGGSTGTTFNLSSHTD